MQRIDTSADVRRDSTTMEPLTPTRFSLPVLGPLTRGEEILQFERMRHQIYMVEALRGLKITNPIVHSHPQCQYSPIRWNQLKTIHFSDLVMDKVQKGCVLKCRTVVEPLLFVSLQLLVEDIEGGAKVMMLSLDNYVNERNVMELNVLFPVGRELWIRSPCVKSHEGRPIIRVEDPMNVKLRLSSREIERILEYGPTDAHGWKTKGNELAKRGRLVEAVEAYATGISNAGGNRKIRASLLRRRAGLLYELGKYQAAHIDATESLKFRNVDKTKILLANILLELRSYRKALDLVQQVNEDCSDDLESLLHVLKTCVKEYEEGKYDQIAIAGEALLHDRVLHADYISSDVELRADGVAERGLFATRRIKAGTLFIASKAILCVYADELQEPTHTDGETKDKFDAVREEFVDRLIKMLRKGTARRILQLAGGSQSYDTTLDLRRDDVYDNERVYFVPEEIKQIVQRNSFGGAQRSSALARAVSDSENNSVGGGALFFAPSFLNHSCVPNSTYFTIGDMMFVTTNHDVEEDEELTIHYLYAEKQSERGRNETLERVWDFICHCELCEWERSNEDTCSKAEEILNQSLEQTKTTSPDQAVKQLLSARKKLYRQYRIAMPKIDLVSALTAPPDPPPPSLAKYLIVLYRELSRLVRESNLSVEMSGLINAEYHFIQGPYSHYERIGVIGLPAVRVWEFLFQNPSSLSAADTEAWLDEARRTHDTLLGDGHFAYQYAKFIDGVRSGT